MSRERSRSSRAEPRSRASCGRDRAPISRQARPERPGAQSWSFADLSSEIVQLSTSFPRLEHEKLNCQLATLVPMADVQWLSEPEQRAWRAYLEATSRLSDRFNRDL